MRKIFDFHGGIHPAENKRQSLLTPITDAGIPAELTLPLSQHIGAAATPVVAVGERVLKGQLIAEAAGFVSVPIHAPSSGTIVAIEDRQVAHPSGLLAPCMVLACDGADQWLEHSGTADFEALTREELLAAIRNAGIAGMGGAGFPTAVKLALQPETQIDTLIINGTECEPYITADDVLMRERPEQILAGVHILRHLLRPGETLIGVEDNKPEALAALRAAAEGSGIEIVSFPTKYPSGGEKQLIEILTGKQVPSGGLPLDLGIVCQNVGTAVAVHDAIMLGRPLISRITTVTGDGAKSPGNFEVLLGTAMSYLLAIAGYEAQTNRRLIMGGPMMGFAVASAEVPVVKTTNCLLVPTETELPTPGPAQACIRCGLCAEACPASLLPQQLFWFAQAKEFEKLEQHNLFDCIECGACSWVCPSNIPLVQYYRASKAEVLQLRQDTEKAEHSRLRFEARQERIAREEAEKIAKRAARKKAAEERARQNAAGAGGTDDPIQAAIDRAKAKKAAQQAAGDEQPGEQEQLEKAVQTTRKRLDTATARLRQAQAEGSDLVDALQTGVSKTSAKLEAAERALQEFLRNTTAGPQEEPVADAASAAIEKAMASRAAQADSNPGSHASTQLQNLEQRLDKTRRRLAESRSAGEQEKIIEALESTVTRLEQKIETIRDQLQTVEGD